MFDFTDDKTVFYKIDAGHGTGNHRLNAFDRALLDAGCGNYNLLRVSSILPPAAVQSKTISLPEGSLLSVAYASVMAEPGQYGESVISAAVAIGIPEDKTQVGVIMEYSSRCDKQQAINQVVSMVKTAMADRGIETFSTVSSADSCNTSFDSYACAFAYVAIFN